MTGDIFSKVRQANDSFSRLRQTKGWGFYKRYVSPSLALGFGILDVSYAENKSAATLSNIAAFAASYSTRKMTSFSSALFPTAAYFGTRSVWEFFTNKPFNPIKGHDAGRWGREQTFASGDFEPGSSWKGLLKVLRNPFRHIGARRMSKMITTGAKGYESMAQTALRELGIHDATVKTFTAQTGVLERTATGRFSPMAGTIGLEVKSATGKELMTAVRSFEPGKIILDDIRIAELMRGKKVGSFLRRGEASIFKGIGYKTGTAMESPVMNVKTARMHMQMYGGELLYQGGLATTGQKARILAKKMTSAEYGETFGIATAMGHLPSRKALSKIYRRDMTWGIGWTQKAMKGNFSIAQTMSNMSHNPHMRPAGLCQRLNAQRNGSKGVRRDFEG